jgi:hypothetical protein
MNLIPLMMIHAEPLNLLRSRNWEYVSCAFYIVVARKKEEKRRMKE